MEKLGTTDAGIVEIRLENSVFLLHPYRSVYWMDADILIVSDLHLGKIQHFRNSGIYVPAHASLDNYERLSSLLLDFAPKTLLVLGDLFHSHYNQDWKNFCELRNSFSDIAFELVPGNHDIVDPDLFKRNNVLYHEQDYHQGRFYFSHYPPDCPSELYAFAGHIHPGIKLVADGLPSLRLPCFYFGTRYALLPSFGTFTGMSMIQPEPGDQVIAITDEGLVKLNTSNDQ